MDKTTTIHQPRFRATYQGSVIGWYDTADEAQAAIDKLEEEEIDDDAEE